MSAKSELYIYTNKIRTYQWRKEKRALPYTLRPCVCVKTNSVKIGDKKKLSLQIGQYDFEPFRENKNTINQRVPTIRNTNRQQKKMKTTRWEVGGVVKELGPRNELTTRREKESDERENKA